MPATDGLCVPQDAAFLDRLQRDRPSWHRALTAGVDLLPAIHEPTGQVP